MTGPLGDWVAVNEPLVLVRPACIVHAITDYCSQTAPKVDQFLSIAARGGVYDKCGCKSCQGNRLENAACLLLDVCRNGMQR